VLGFGVVEAKSAEWDVQPNHKDYVAAHQVQAAGVFIGTGPAITGLMAGVVKRQGVDVPTTANVLISAESRGDSFFRVDVQSVAPTTAPSPGATPTPPKEIGQ